MNDEYYDLVRRARVVLERVLDEDGFEDCGLSIDTWASVHDLLQEINNALETFQAASGSTNDHKVVSYVTQLTDERLQRKIEV